MSDESDVTRRRLLVVKYKLPWRVSIRYKNPTTDINEDETFNLENLDVSQVEWEYTLRERQFHSFNTKNYEKYNACHIGLLGHITTPNGDKIDIETLPETLRKSLVDEYYQKKKCVPVMGCSSKTISDHQEYCSKELLPILIQSPKSLSSLLEPYSMEKWLGYSGLCKTFAEHVLCMYVKNDIVWVHDYKLLLVPEFIRKEQQNSHIGLFIHKPFPSSELFRCLGERKEILRGMLGANIIGFRIYAHTRHFISACSRILGIEKNGSALELDGRIINVQSTVVMADEEEITEFLSNDSVQERIKNLKNTYKGKKIIIGIEKGYQISSILNKLCSYYKFLETHPEWAKKVVLIQVTLPFEEDQNEHLKQKIMEIESRINSKFGSLEFTPLCYHHRYLEQEEYYSLMTAADLGLFISTKTGLSLAVLEYIICQKQGNNPLIISEFMGTAGLFPTSIRVNPCDHDEVARAINNALTSHVEDNVIKYNYLYDTIKNKNTGLWMNSFVDYLEVLSADKPLSSQKLQNLHDSNIKESFAKANKRLLLFDYDGTLVDICPHPDKAIAPSSLLDVLKTLSSNPKNEVYVISGRDKAFLESQFKNIDGVGLSSEHGCFVKCPYGNEWIDLSSGVAYSWMNEVNNIFNFYTERTAGTRVENKQCSVVWHYRNSDPEFGEFQAKQCKEQLKSLTTAYSDIEVLSGKRNIEVRSSSISKANVVKILIKRHYLSNNKMYATKKNKHSECFTNSTEKHNLPENISGEDSILDGDRVHPFSVDLDFIMCAGDDRTDEDMFNVLLSLKPSCDVFCCLVGPPNKPTSAKFHLPNATEMNKLLNSLCQYI